LQLGQVTSLVDDSTIASNRSWQARQVYS